jgi:hypothetical protein
MKVRQIILTKNKPIAIVILLLAAAVFFIVDAHAGDRKTREITMLASGTVTASTAYTTGFHVSAYSEGQVLVNVSAEGSTSTLDIIVQTSDDNSTYYDHTANAQITATGQYRYAFTNFGKYVRLKYTVGGTSFTFAMVVVLKN